MVFSKLKNVWIKYFLAFFGLFVFVHGIKGLLLMGLNIIGFAHTLLGFALITAGMLIKIEKEESYKIFLSFFISFIIAVSFMLFLNNFHLY